MKLQTVNPSVFPTRCTYRRSSGRQCRLAIFDPPSGLCWRAGKNRVSSRRAKVLAYICGLLLRTLPVMAEERRAGITYIPNPPEPDLPRNRHDKRSEERRV